MPVVNVCMGDETRHLRIGDEVEDYYSALIGGLGLNPASANEAQQSSQASAHRFEYQDEEGDSVTVTSDGELREAFRFATEQGVTLALTFITPALALALDCSSPSLSQSSARDVNSASQASMCSEGSDGELVFCEASDNDFSPSVSPVNNETVATRPVSNLPSFSIPSLSAAPSPSSSWSSSPSTSSRDSAISFALSSVVSPTPLPSPSTASLTSPVVSSSPSRRPVFHQQAPLRLSAEALAKSLSLRVAMSPSPSACSTPSADTPIAGSLSPSAASYVYSSPSPSPSAASLDSLTVPSTCPYSPTPAPSPSSLADGLSRPSSRASVSSYTSFSSSSLSLSMNQMPLPLPLPPVPPVPRPPSVSVSRNEQTTTGVGVRFAASAATSPCSPSLPTTPHPCTSQGAKVLSVHSPSSSCSSPSSSSSTSSYYDSEASPSSSSLSDSDSDFSHASLASPSSTISLPPPPYPRRDPGLPLPSPSSLLLDASPPSQSASSYSSLEEEEEEEGSSSSSDNNSSDDEVSVSRLSQQLEGSQELLTPANTNDYDEEEEAGECQGRVDEGQQDEDDLVFNERGEPEDPGQEAPFERLCASYIIKFQKQLNNRYNELLEDYRQEQARLKAHLDEMDTGSVEVNNALLRQYRLNSKRNLKRFHQNVAILSERFERHMRALPTCSFLQPLRVDLVVTVPGRTVPLYAFPNVSLRPTWCVSELYQVFRALISAQNQNQPCPAFNSRAAIVMERLLSEDEEKLRRPRTERALSFSALFGLADPAPQNEKPPLPRIKTYEYERLGYDDESVMLGDLNLGAGARITLKDAFEEKKEEKQEVKEKEVKIALAPAEGHPPKNLPAGVQLGDEIVQDEGVVRNGGEEVSPQTRARADSIARKRAWLELQRFHQLRLQQQRRAEMYTNPLRSPPPRRNSWSPSISSSSSSSSSSNSSQSPKAPVCPSYPAFSFQHSSVPAEVLSTDAFGQEWQVLSKNQIASEEKRGDKSNLDCLSPGGLKAYQEGVKRLDKAVMMDNVGALLNALDSGADCNAQLHGGLGWTALHKSCAMGHLDLLPILIEHGADIDALDLQGWTPLMRACKAGHLSVAKALIERGADFLIQNEKGHSALDIAQEFGHAALAAWLQSLHNANAQREQVASAPAPVVTASLSSFIASTSPLRSPFAEPEPSDRKHPDVESAASSHARRMSSTPRFGVFERDAEEESACDTTVPPVHRRNSLKAMKILGIE